MIEVPQYFQNNFDYYESSGGNIRIVGGLECPYCNKKGKLYVKPSKHWIYCFHCSKNYNLIEFVSDFEGISKAEARKLLTENKAPDHKYTPTKPKAEIKTDPKQYFPSLTELPQRAIDYFAHRNIPTSALRHFRVLYSPSNDIFNDKLIYTSDRVIFPIFDINGKLHSWQGRDISGKSSVKYLMSPDCKPSQHLFNADRVPKNPDYLIVTEGVMDTIGWFKNGFKNAVATFGKKISKEQIKLIRQINPKALFIAWDYDCYSEMAGFYSKVEHLIKAVRIIEMPDGKDADECSSDEWLNCFRDSSALDWKKKVLSKL